MNLTLEQYSPGFEFKKLKEPTAFSNEYTYTTQRRDIDVNKHMHNLNYLDLAYEALPEEVYFNQEFRQHRNYVQNCN